MIATTLTRLQDAMTPTLNGVRDLLLLALRLYIAWVFFKSGLTKIADWETTIFLFTEEYSVPLVPPALAAFAGTAGELLLPPMLALGLLGRLAALGLFVVNMMAVISYPALHSFDCPAALQSHYFWGAMLAVLFAVGPGRLAGDTIVARQLGKASRATM
jgi:putative oxidoreductase